MDDDEGEGGGYGDGNYGGDGDVVGDGGKDRNGDGEEDTGDGGSGRDGCEKSEDLWDARLHRIKVVLKNSPDFNVDAESKAVEWRGKLSADTYQFFHGCGNALSLYSFSDDGVQPNSGSSYYSADGASYWTSSKPFAVWWAATRQVPEVAASAFAIGRSEKAAYIRDHTPDDFDAIRCVIAVCNWSREDIKINDYGDWYSLKSAEEEKSYIYKNTHAPAPQYFPPRKDPKDPKFDYIVGFTQGNTLRDTDMKDINRALIFDPNFVGVRGLRGNLSFRRRTDRVEGINLRADDMTYYEEMVQRGAKNKQL